MSREANPRDCEGCGHKREGIKAGVGPPPSAEEAEIIGLPGRGAAGGQAAGPRVAGRGQAASPPPAASPPAPRLSLPRPPVAIRKEAAPPPGMLTKHPKCPRVGSQPNRASEPISCIQFLSFGSSVQGWVCAPPPTA